MPPWGLYYKAVSPQVAHHGCTLTRMVAPIVACFPRAPPTLNLARPDPALLPGLVGMGGIGGGGAVELPANQRVAALSNSFGFGGTNTSLLLTSV